MKKLDVSHRVMAVSIIVVMIFGIVTPTAFAENCCYYEKGFDKGVSWMPIVPMKQATLVKFDNMSLLDDYAYLASVPTSVFYNNGGENGQLFSHPLLYFEDEFEYGSNDKTRSLNAYQGIDYFMEDWTDYSNDRLDELTLINVDKSELNYDWDANNYVTIEGENPFDLANKIALEDWSHSDKAVVAVIEEEYDVPDEQVEGSIDGFVPSEDGILEEHFEVPKTNEVYPQFNEFIVPDGYKFLKVRSWYPCFYLELGIPGFEGLINMSIPAGDRDLQIYCNLDGQWMMAGITSAWNAQSGMDADKTSVYVYESGRWSVGLTDVPTKDLGSYSHIIY